MARPLKFSIITPSYRQLDWLKIAAASVNDQQGVEVEHLVQDAGTGPELEEWFRVHNRRSRLFVESDSGMYDAINRGFRKAAGDILAWLNCDEQYLPGALAKVADFFENNPGVDVLFGDAVLLSEKGELLSYRRAIPPSLAHIQLSHLNTLSCATFIRRSVIERGFLLDTEWKTIADVVWVAALLKAKLRMGVLPEPLAAFTLTSENLGQSSLAFKEGQRWQEQTTRPWQRALKLPVVIAHRIRKFFYGAYAIRNFSTEIYTQGSGVGQRIPVASANLSFTWTRSSKAGVGLLFWKAVCDLGHALSLGFRRSSKKSLPFGFYHPPAWPLSVRLGLPVVFAVVILYFEQQSGTAIIVAPMLSTILMLVISSVLEPLQLIPFALAFTAVIFWSLRYMQPFDPANSTDWIRLGLRITGFITAATLAVLFSKFRCEAKARQDQTIEIITTMPMPVIISDALGVILFANDEAVEFTKMARAELIGALYPRLFMISQDEGTAMRNYIKFFQAIPEAGSAPGSTNRKICLTGEGHDSIEARFICLGQGECRYMVTVIKA